ncbi:hypothetical protein KAI87_17990, partial [Myxococcota bacterium]|nr:hypothetical protein [Myxococcota bacterium]
DLTALVGLRPFDCGEDNKCYLAAVQHFDFYAASIFKVGTSSLGPGVYTRLTMPWGMKLSADAALLGILLGALDSPYVDEEYRDYNLGQGLNSRVDLHLQKPGLGALHFQSAQYWIATVDGINGHEFANILRASALIPIYAGFGLELGAGLYGRAGIYDDYASVDRKVTLVQVHLHWNGQHKSER